MVNSLESALLIAEAADEKKAFDILILDLRGLTYLADYFVICSGSTATQVGAIADQIMQVLAMHGVRTSHVEGQAGSTWVLMDYGDVVVHIFDEQTRIYYSLEKLWNDARRVPPGIVRRSLQGASS
jgi:ribosome-associated protein